MKKIKNILFYISLLFSICIIPLYICTEDLNTPAEKFNLVNCKLQIPGPTDINKLDTYSSKYFYLNDKNEMIFWLNSSEKGTTKNTIFIRSELRHLLNWDVNENHKMIASLKIISNLNPNKVTVLKIHGFTKIREYAPTLLRIAYNYDNLYAYINKSNKPKDTERILLVENIGQEVFQCSILVINKILIVKINNEEKINRDISYWEYKNYFKAGCYPQSHKGEVKIIFQKLFIE